MSRRPRDRRDRARGRRDGTLIVADSGPGIAAEVVPDLFTPFFTSFFTSYLMSLSSLCCTSTASKFSPIPASRSASTFFAMLSPPGGRTAIWSEITCPAPMELAMDSA